MQVITLSANSRAAKSVEFSVRNRYWLSYKCFCVLTKLSNWEYIIFSMTFEIAGSRVIDLLVYSQVLKLLERVLDARIRRRVECDFGEEQQGFMKGRGTAGWMYVLRQMVEKRLEVQGSMALGFVDLEKAFDTVPREMVMATLRWMGIPAAEVRMVEGTYEKTTARVVVAEGASEEFEVKIGLRQGSVLSPCCS